MHLTIEKLLKYFYIWDGNILTKLLYLPGNTKGGSVTVLLTSCLTGLD